jgi:hypothetical protein
MGVLFGIWECTACGSRTLDNMPMPGEPCECSGPKGKRWVFAETRVEHPVPGTNALLTGYYDGKLHVESRYMLEMKFPGPKSLKRAVKAPSDGYVYQLRLYMAIEKWDGLGLLFYGDKNDGGEPVEHIVHPDESVLPEVEQKIREIEEAKAMLVRWAESGEKLDLPCRICADEREGRYGRWCPWGEECFNDVLLKDALDRVPE